MAAPLISPAAVDPHSTFDPQVPGQHLLFPDLPGDRWRPMLQSQCTFEPDMFLQVLQNLIKNPNIMSTHLFRADILYDSQKDQTIISEPGEQQFSEYTKHLKKDCQPVYTPVSGFQWQQTYVRQLVPRNRQLDKDLLQTCHFFVKRSGVSTSNLILYVPHVSDSADMPWYHPKVKQVAFLHEFEKSSNRDTKHTGTVSVHFCEFDDVELDQRLERTALQLLSKIHKHSRGQQAGYVKRGRHDLIVTQQKFQETYARLKAKYAKTLIEGWVEETDPSKHIFEDLGIAAFLIELWSEMYDCSSASGSLDGDQAADDQAQERRKFPGFVDIGCGNGLLVNLLVLEGYPGWGFDARRRKTWETFAPEIRESIKEMVLVPEVLHIHYENTNGGEAVNISADALEHRAFHNGVFWENDGSDPPFIISNHADELTPWTPLISYLNGSSFIAIPCCSHNLAGARFRAPVAKQVKESSQSAPAEDGAATTTRQDIGLRDSQAAETGSLKKSAAGKKMPSAYASLCDYVTKLANEVGFTVEKEMLRIPSTRNACLLGRFPTHGSSGTQNVLSTSANNPIDLADIQEKLSASKPTDPASSDMQIKQTHVQDILTRELDTPLANICDDWISRAKQIAGKVGDGH